MRPAQGAACEHHALLLRSGGEYAVHPLIALGVGECDTSVHLIHHLGRVQVVGIDQIDPESFGEGRGHGGFARTRHPHHDDHH